MGENEGWAEPGGPSPNGLLPDAGPVMRALDADRLLKAEECVAELIACIQPNQISEDRRNAVADYVQRLIMKCFPCQVCTFGSVPLKTYLPDGDIDLTAFSNNQNLKDTWANHVREMLKSEEKNENAEFHVKEVQYIQAEVKIIKCLVENIVVDISFNQVGGLCTLCFLDEVDYLINQNHLFKRSIILIKAWCYYESRILGAHHGLISTYALETLVLYIFHVFNNSFHGPLEVLYRFLEFFSNFDWDNFCVSLWGPVPLRSLPNVTAEHPTKDSGELLLSKVFLDACSSVYAVFPGGLENNGQPFGSKYFNVIDPLRVNNNLGRSVSKGNFFRIRSAFAFGAQRLARLLECPKENMIFEVNQFFMNTWGRHGHRPDAPVISSWSSSLSAPDMSHEFGSSNNNNSNNKKVKEDSHDLKSRFNSNSMRVTQQIGRDTIPNHAIPKHLPSGTQGRLIFARTRSSPELTDNYINVSSQIQRNRRTGNADTSYSRPGSSNQNQNLGSVSLPSHIIHSSAEDAFVKHGPTQNNLYTDDYGISNNYHLNSSLDGFDDEFPAHIMNQEEQDIVNMMASASLQSFNGQDHAPLNLTPGHLPYSSLGYTQRRLPEFFPTDIPHVQFPHGLVSPQWTHYFPGIGLNNTSEDSVERTNENFGTVDMSSVVEADNNFWKQQGGGYGVENGNLDTCHYVDKPTRLRVSSVSHSNSLRSQTSSESSWDGSSAKASSKYTKEKRREKLNSTDLTASHGKGKITSDQIFNDTDDDDDKKWGPSTHVGSEIVPRQHMPVFEVSEANGSDPMTRFAPMFINPGPRQRTNGNSGLITFYPTGPPIPFLTMLPLYNIPPETGTDETTYNSESATEQYEEQKFDVLNSDFASHLQNLQLGRSCQNSRSVMVPPVYVQDRLPYENPGRPLSTNTNMLSQFTASYGQRAVPVAPVQPVSGRYRGGTGTYLPNHVNIPLTMTPQFESFR